MAYSSSLNKTYHFNPQINHPRLFRSMNYLSIPFGHTFIMGDIIFTAGLPRLIDYGCLEGLCFTDVPDVLHSLTLAYTELIGMAFPWAIPYLINMISTKAFV